MLQSDGPGTAPNTLAGLVPAIHVFACGRMRLVDVDARDQSGQSDLFEVNGLTIGEEESGRRCYRPATREETAMAKNGFRLIDAEMHVMEPTDLWQRYIDPEFKARAPRRLSDRKWDIRTLVEGEVMAQIPGGDWPAETGAEERALAERYAEEIARN